MIYNTLINNCFGSVETPHWTSIQININYQYQNLLGHAKIFSFKNKSKMIMFQKETQEVQWQEKVSELFAVS